MELAYARAPESLLINSYKTAPKIEQEFKVILMKDLHIFLKQNDLSF